jgi:hypothetical protein
MPVNTPCAEYEAHKDQWERCRDTREGSDAVKARVAARRAIWFRAAREREPTFVAHLMGSMALDIAQEAGGSWAEAVHAVLRRAPKREAA